MLENNQVEKGIEKLYLAQKIYNNLFKSEYYRGVLRV
jgi:hypothetical protein